MGFLVSSSDSGVNGGSLVLLNIWIIEYCLCLEDMIGRLYGIFIDGYLYVQDNQLRWVVRESSGRCMQDLGRRVL